jgi:DNA polymerase-3 subunit delta'
MPEVDARLPAALGAATEHQPRARAALLAALAAGPSHAYLFRGPRGAGKRAAARAFAAELLASAADDPDDTRRRAMLDPSPHPDLVWLVPRGAQHLVEEVREGVIRAASYRPFEGGRRVFVIEAAEAMRDESQNAMLKTLEEPPHFAHLVLISSEPEALLETIVSRCEPIEFGPLPVAAVEETLADEGEPAEVAAAARLAAGDLDRARFLVGERGRDMRAKAEACAAAAVEGGDAGSAWRALLDVAEEAGADAESATREALEEQASTGAKRSARDISDEARRAGRRRRTEVLDLGLGLCASWFRDLAAVACGADDVAFNRDRLDRLRGQAEGLDPNAARAAMELIADTRRRLDLNVSEELALEALAARLRRALAG